MPISWYLGLPLGASFKRKDVWYPVEERIRRRLTGWKSQYLSNRGKITLIQSVLASMPTYFMSLLVILGKVAQTIEKFQRDFFGCIRSKIQGSTW